MASPGPPTPSYAAGFSGQGPSPGAYPASPGAYPQVPGGSFSPGYPPQQQQQQPQMPPQQQQQFPPGQQQQFSPQQQPFPGQQPYPGIQGVADGPTGQQPAAQPGQQQAPAPGAAPGEQPGQRKGLRRLFGRKQQPDPNAPPGQDGSAPAGGAADPSPQRKGFFGRLRSKTAGGAEQQQGQAQQAGAGAGMMQPGVPVVPPPTGMCSKPPPPTEEVARLQGSPLAPSKIGLFNKPISSRRNTTDGVPAAGKKGAPAVDPAFPGPAPLAPMYGPFLRYGGYDPPSRTYRLSVLAVVHQTKSPYAPHLRYRDIAVRGSEVVNRTPTRLWSYAGYNFWRWDMALKLGAAPAVVEYAVVCSSDHFFSTVKRYRFHLPSAGQKWHWGFYSCNGFDDPAHAAAAGGIQPLWRDVMAVHGRDPLHVMFGGGDQLYCDEVWKLPSLVEWLNMADKPSRYSHPFSQAMVNEVFDYYFRAYSTHWSQPVFGEALSCIPQAMMWDDHDIFDGWGSYPPEMQSSPVFAGVFFVARKFYLLFQQHAAEDNFRELNRGWGLTGLSYTAMLGNTTAVVALDTRGERSKEQVVRPASWAAFQDQLARLPAGVRHVVVLATVPVIYPSIPKAEEAMMFLAGTGLMANAVNAFLNKSGLAHHIYSQFGEPELLDDLLDHWSAPIHKMEKYCFIKIMQDMAAARGLRFTLLSGDVHCAGIGRLHTHPKMNFKADPRYMVQVISSAIGNVPPPDAVLKALAASQSARMLDEATRETMKPVFEGRTLLKGARNWCDVHERPLLAGSAAAAAALAGGVAGGPADGSLIFQLRVEHPTYGEVRPQTYDISVPALELPPGSFSPGPLAAPPPLPQPLMVRFQAELAAAGVGLDAAMPPPPPPPGSGAPAAMIPVPVGNLSPGAGVGGAGGHHQQQVQQQVPGGPLPLQPVGIVPGSFGAGQQQQPQYGLQSDINNQQQQQQQQQYGGVGAGAGGTGQAYPSITPAATAGAQRPYGQLAPYGQQQQQQPLMPVGPGAGPAALQASFSQPAPGQQQQPVAYPPLPPQQQPYGGAQQQQQQPGQLPYTYSSPAAMQQPYGAPGGAGGPGYSPAASQPSLGGSPYPQYGSIGSTSYGNSGSLSYGSPGTPSYGAAPPPQSYSPQQQQQPQGAQQQYPSVPGGAAPLVPGGPPAGGAGQYPYPPQQQQPMQPGQQQWAGQPGPYPAPVPGY